MNRARPRSAALRHAAAAALLTLVWLAMLVFGKGAVDAEVYRTLYAGGDPPLIVAARVFTFLGEPFVLIPASIAAALWLWRLRRIAAAKVMFLVPLIGRVLSEAQKYWIGRPRPTLEPHLVVANTTSFPSGHAANSMIVYLTLALVCVAGGRWARIAAAGATMLSLLIGSSRVMLGVHWPSDVIGGWAFGLLWVLLTLRRSERLFRSDAPAKA